MKRVLITGGPTNEYIDEVMKITNMSSGKIATQLANAFLKGGYAVTLLLTKNIIFKCEENEENVKVARFETTDQLLSAIDNEAKENIYDIIIHSAAVADYKPEYSFRLEDIAKEIMEKVVHCFECRKGDCSIESQADYQKTIFDVLTNPQCKVNDTTKISSVEPNLTVKLGLTPKIIATLRDKFPNAFICGFKLLENVPEEELIDAAMKQIEKCNTNLVFANDLAELRKGKTERLVVTPNGFNGIRVNGADGIYNFIKEVTEV